MADSPGGVLIVEDEEEHMSLRVSLRVRLTLRLTYGATSSS
jgi:hypothetical protein